MKLTCKRIVCNVAAGILAACMLATPALAAASDHNGPGKLFHLPDGTQISRTPLTEEQTNFYLQWERKLYGNDAYMHTSNNEIGTLHVAVGETITLHASQVTMGYLDDATPRDLYRRTPDSEVHTYIDTVVQRENFSDITRKDLFHVQETVNTHLYDYYCLEWSITGLSEGVDYLWYQDSPFEAEYLMIVVGGTPSSTSTASNSSSSTSTTSNSSTSITTSTGTAASTPAQTQRTASGASVVYTVQPGDTLGNIALNVYGDISYWPQLKEANREYLAQTKDGVIYAGFNLYLPDDIGNGRIAAPTAGTGEVLYTVQAGDSYASIAQAHFGDAGRYMEIFNRNQDRLQDLNTLFEGQILVLP